MEFTAYKNLFATLTEQEKTSPYGEKEMENISRKISNFLRTVDESSSKNAARNICFFIYFHQNENCGNFRRIPYNGKDDAEAVSLDFDLKYMPPVLARLISKYTDSVFQ